MLCSSVEHLSHEFNRLKKDKFEKVTELTPHFVINQVHQQGISPFKLIESITLLAKNLHIDRAKFLSGQKSEISLYLALVSKPNA